MVVGWPLKLTPSIPAKLDDPDAERVRRNLDDRISELQALPFTRATVIQNVSLPDATDIPVAHSLGRKPLAVLVSPPRDNTAAGRISETRATNYSRDKVIVLQANGYGATILVDLVVL